MTAAPCPPWCDEPSGHPFDEAARLHTGRVGSVSLCAVELAGMPCEPPMIHVDCDDELNSDQARQLAADLLAAVEVMREDQ